MFHVEDTKSPQSKNLVFHKRHCMEPNNPELFIEYVSLTVKVVKSKTIETAKSRRL